MRGLLDLLTLSTEEKQRLGIEATAKEIAQQPTTWSTTSAIFDEHRQELRQFLVEAGVTCALSERPAVILTGAGTSDYIGQTLTLLMRKEWGCETEAVASTDLLTNLADYLVPGRRYLVISFSRSGDSPEGVAVLGQMLAQYPYIAHLIVTCNQSAKMLELIRPQDRAYVVVLDDAVNDRGLAMTSSFTNMVVFGQLLAHTFTDVAYRPIFQSLISAAESFVPRADTAALRLAADGYRRACVIGSGALTGVARESALKVLELTAGRIQTKSESVLGLRHGPMAALDRETLLICFASGEAQRHRYEADLLAEVGRKGVVGARVVVGPTGASRLPEQSDLFLEVGSGIPDVYRPPLDVIFGQLLGFHASIHHGLRPDSPSPDGVISRVVEEFPLYQESR